MSTFRSSTAAMLAALTLLTAACGSGDDDGTTVIETDAETGGDAPITD